MDTTSLGDRMKDYESCSKNFLTRRMPVIVRLDGKAFHTFTKSLDKPYDTDFRDLMMETAEYLVDNIMGCRLAYVQSDEISLLLIDYSRLETEAWYKNNVQKIVSVSASMATAKFNQLLETKMPVEKRLKISQEFAMFDSRAFNIPREEVCNYFIWRQNDASRNSVQGLGQANFSHKQLQGKNNNDIQDMLMIEKGINWNDVETYFKRGGCVYRGVTTERIVVIQKEYKLETIGDNSDKGKVQQYPSLGYKENQVVVDWDIPRFTQDRDYIDAHVFDETKRINDEALLKRHSRDIAASLLESE